MSAQSRERRDAVSPLLRVESVSKSYGPVTVLQDVSLDIEAGSVVSIVGENGAGKSTLMNMLSGIVAPDSGSIRLRQTRFAPSDYRAATELGVSRVFQEQSLVLNVPVYANLVLGQAHRFSRFGVFDDRRAMIDVAQRIVADAGLDIDVTRITATYDFSARQSIEIARACLAPHHVLGIETPLILLDEPTSALDRRDEETFFTLIETLRARAAFLFVSHRLSEVLRIADVIYVMKDGRIVGRRAASQTDENELHSLMVGRERADDFYFQSRRRARAHSDAPALVVKGLTLAGEYHDIDFEVRAGEIVGIGGLLDSGKSALGKGIAGVDEPDAGTVALNGQPARRPDIVDAVAHGLAYVPAERLTDGLIASVSTAWNVSLASGRDLFSNRWGAWRIERERRVAARYIESLRIRSATPDTTTDRLSGGNQQKVVLARWLCREPRVLVLDNPTRGIDAGAKEDIYGLLRDLTDQGVAIVLITDELLELIGLANRVLILQRGRISAEVDIGPDAAPTERELVAHMLPKGRDEAALDTHP
ncbi:sugar ABC transporter ATP-binding protein [Pararobbsia silviterrae]|uniref:sugar ABC transporter ATP-binding protein n=1 Tax=Pararobbsia silviterrae TaxID=1792498 RepID=UPI0013148379|nr:sugar ABC transporter ATP-binding protein [Pararobbsia silviterrae]